MNLFQLCSAKVSFLMDWLEFRLRQRKTVFSWDMFAVRAISIWKWEAFYDQRLALKRNEQREKLHLINADEENQFQWIGFRVSDARMRKHDVKKKTLSNFSGKRVKINEESIEMRWFPTFLNSQSQQSFNHRACLLLKLRNVSARIWA